MATEMQTKPHSEPSAEASSATELGPNALAAIREILDSESAAGPTPASSLAVEGAVAPRRARPIAAQPRRVYTKAGSAPEDATPNKSSYAQNDASRAGLTDAKADDAASGLKAKLNSYRPTPKHLILAGIALLVLFRPWLVVGMLFLGLLVMVGVFLILGYDGFWRRAMRVARWYAQRRPSRTAELHRKLDSFAMKWDAVLDRFPEGTVDGLYLPDFGDLANAESRHDAALDRRFSDLREGEA